MKIFFDVLHLYYFPHFRPVIQELAKARVEIGVLFYQEPQSDITEFLATFPNIHIFTKDTPSKSEVIDFYLNQKPNWVVFGNSFSAADKLNPTIKTAIIQHGIGPKATYYEVSRSPINFRFVESHYRCNKLQSMFPNKTFITTGYSKLDPIVNQTLDKPSLESLGLDPNKKTLLYAPTFYPSTIENFPKHWPQQFYDYNIIIKPHYFSYVNPKYGKQRRLLNHWATFDNVHLVSIESQSLLPYITTSDILLSEASSTMFEFAALDKPVIICDFVKLRWSYRGIFRFRLNNRIDSDFERYKSIASVAKQYTELKPMVIKNLEQPRLYQAKRHEFTKELVGRVDGKASVRIAEYILNNG